MQKCSNCEENEATTECNNAPVCARCSRQTAMYESHVAALVREFGLEKAKKTNVGWACTDDSIASKVYGVPTWVTFTCPRPIWYIFQTRHDGFGRIVGKSVEEYRSFVSSD